MLSLPSPRAHLPPAPPLTPAAGFTHELCAGLVDKPELSLAGIAAEEVAEECGYQVAAAQLRELASSVSSAGTAGTTHTVFYGRVSGAAWELRGSCCMQLSAVRDSQRHGLLTGAWRTAAGCTLARCATQPHWYHCLKWRSPAVWGTMCFMHYSTCATLPHAAEAARGVLHAAAPAPLHAPAPAPSAPSA